MIPNIYKYDYKWLVILPLILLLASLYFLPAVKLGVDFKGGTLIQIQLTDSVDESWLEERLYEEGLDAKVRSYTTSSGSGIEIEIEQDENIVRAEQLKERFLELSDEVSRLQAIVLSGGDEKEYSEKRDELNGVANELFALASMKENGEDYENINELKELGLDAYNKIYGSYEEKITSTIEEYVEYNSISIQTTSPVLSETFISQAIYIAIASAILSGIAVFVFFRTVIPSIAVLIGAGCDIVIALGAMGLFGIPLTLPSFAALLMLVGFSLDTDILLTTRMLKRKGEPREKAYESMKTGITMSAAALVAFLVLFALSYLTHIPTYYEISAVALSGLVGDVFATWGINAVIMLAYLEGKK